MMTTGKSGPQLCLTMVVVSSEMNVGAAAVSCGLSGGLEPPPNAPPGKSPTIPHVGCLEPSPIAPPGLPIATVTLLSPVVAAIRLVAAVSTVCH